MRNEIIQGIFTKLYNSLGRTLLRRIPYMWNISNILFRLLWGGKSVIEVEGSRMHINVDDPDVSMRKTFQAYALNLVHEEATTSLFKQIVRPGDVVLDIGANIGYFTLLSARLAGENGKVFSFEPEPKNFGYLTRNIELNSYKNILANQVAVSNENGKTKLFVCAYDSGHHTIKQGNGIEAYRQGRRGETREIEIDTISIDAFLRDKTDKVDVVKIDVEGAEALAVEGMRETLKKNADIKIFLEFFPLLIQKMGNSPSKLVESLMKDLGFQIFAIGHDYSMQDSDYDSVRIESSGQLSTLLREEAGHINLFLIRK